MIFIGAVRTVGGITLLIKGNQLKTDMPIIATNLQTKVVVIGLIVIGLLLIYASIKVLKKYTKSNWNMCCLALIIFFIDGLINGYFLFGQPLDTGQRINLINNKERTIRKHPP